MLIKTAILEQIVAGEITTLFRRWKRQAAKPDGTQMTHLGVLQIGSVEIVTAEQITEKEARSAGFCNVKKLLASLPESSDPIYRIQVSYAGADPRISLRQQDDLTQSELTAIIEKLSKMDARTAGGAWTQTFLTLIKKHPNTRAAELAAKVSIDVPKFKPMVRKLKALGLTESLDVGYRLSPRGNKVLENFLSEQGK